MGFRAPPVKSWICHSSGGSEGGAPGAPPYGPKICNFMQFFGKFWQNRRLALPPGGLAPPPTGNPGFAPALYHLEAWMFFYGLAPFTKYPGSAA